MASFEKPSMMAPAVKSWKRKAVSEYKYIVNLNLVLEMKTYHTEL